MNDFTDENKLDDDEEDKKLKSDEDEGEEDSSDEDEGEEDSSDDSSEGDEGDGAPARSLNVSEQAFAHMFQIGLSKERIAEVLENWRHMKGEGVLKAVASFMRNLVKSHHVEVEIDKEKNFNVVHDLIQDSKHEDDPHAAKPHHAHHVQPSLGPK